MLTHTISLDGMTAYAGNLEITFCEVLLNPGDVPVLNTPDFLEVPVFFLRNLQ